MELSEFQSIIRRAYLERDRERGIDGTFRWLVEEVGELARALRTWDGVDRSALEHETGDVLAWLTAVANLVEMDMESAARRYAEGCPRCGLLPCACPPA